jgi:hypothetical protein
MTNDQAEKARIAVGHWSLGFGHSLVLGPWSLVIFFGSLVFATPTSSAPPPEPARKDPIVVDEKTEPIIKGALKYLASKQSPNGAWAVTVDEQQHPVAITGYTLMAFQAAGQLPGEGEFGKNVSAGLQYLLDSTSADGLWLRSRWRSFMVRRGRQPCAKNWIGSSRSSSLRRTPRAAGAIDRLRATPIFR